MLTTIKIEKLFNTFDYTIELKPGGITILTGPNGYGKTTVLKILNSTFQPYFTFLDGGPTRVLPEVPFRQVSLKFSDNRLIEILKDSQKSFDISQQVYFVTEQRLWMNTKLGAMRTIREYAQELRIIIQDKLTAFSQIARELDSSFPHRLFVRQEKISETEFKQRFQQIISIQKKLNNHNIVDFKEDNQPSYREEDARALAVYIEDTEKKLAVFAELLEKLNFFTEILNERRFTFKQIHISRDEGFTLSTDDSKSLSPQNLSSGEQQQVVMLYELLFKIQPNTLVLIDEPELSLHVVWQQEFLNDLEKIVTWQKIQVIIATHSPQIINERWDLVVDLWDLHHAKPTE